MPRQPPFLSLNGHLTVPALTGPRLARREIGAGSSMALAPGLPAGCGCRESGLLSILWIRPVSPDPPDSDGLLAAIHSLSLQLHLLYSMYSYNDRYNITTLAWETGRNFLPTALTTAMLYMPYDFDGPT